MHLTRSELKRRLQLGQTILLSEATQEEIEAAMDEILKGLDPAHQPGTRYRVLTEEASASGGWTKTGRRSYRHASGHTVSLLDNGAWRLHAPDGAIKAAGKDRASLEAHLKTAAFPILAIGGTDAAESRDGEDRHAQMAAAFRHEPSPARTLTEDRTGREPTDADKYDPTSYYNLAKEYNLQWPPPAPTLVEHREAVIPPNAHTIVASAFRGAEPEVPEGSQERMANIFRGA